MPTLTPNWTDFNESDLGTTLIELLSAFGDMICYQIDMQALETYIGTVQQRTNAQNILKLIGYYMSGYVSPIVSLSITLTVPQANSVTIPAYSVFTTGGANPISFATTESITFLPMSTPAPQTLTVNAWGGTVVAVPISYISILADNTYGFTDQNMDFTTMTVVTGTTTWSQVNDVYFQSNQSSAVYSMEINNDYPTMVLTPAWQVYLNSVTPIMNVTYVSTQGPTQAVGANTVTVIPTSTVIVDSQGNPMNSYLTVNNPASSTPGSLPMTVAQAQEVSVEEALSQNSCVRLSDYVAQAKKVAGVFDALAFDSTIPASGITETLYVQVVVVPTGYGTPSQTLLNEVQSNLVALSFPNMTIDVVAPIYYVVNFTMNVYMSSSNSSQASSVQSLITSSLQSLLSNSSNYVNGIIPFSVIVSTIQNSSTYIQYIEMVSPTSDVTPSANSYPVIGTVNPTFVYTS